MKTIIVSFTDGIAPSNTSAIKKALTTKTSEEKYRRIFELTGTTWTYEQTELIWDKYIELIEVELFTPIKELMNEAILITLKNQNNEK